MKLEPGKLYKVDGMPSYMAAWNKNYVTPLGQLKPGIICLYLKRIKFSDDIGDETYLKLLYKNKIIYIDYSWKNNFIKL